MKVDIDGRPFMASWLHGTYNSTLWMSMDEDGVEVFDLYYPKDQEVLKLESLPEVVEIDGDLQIHFYHGRETVETELDDWGSDGPIVKVSRVTLGRAGINLVVEDKIEHLGYVGDLLYYQGVYYGDIAISEAGE